MLQYSLNRFDIDAEQFLQRYIELNPENEGVVMTMAEQLANSRKAEFIQEGIQQGRQEGIYEVAKSMLLKGLDDKLITETTGLDLEIVAKLKSEIKH